MSKIKTSKLIVILVVVIGFGILFSSATNVTGNWFLFDFLMGYNTVEPESPAITEPVYKSDVLLVKFKEGVSDNDIKGLYKRFALMESKNINNILHVIRVPEQALLKVEGALSHNPMIEVVEKDYLQEISMLTDDPRTGSQYYLNLMHYPEAWDISTGVSEVIVSNPDTGIFLEHEDLTNVLLKELAFNSVDGSNNATPVYSHGTRTAGCIGADTNNGLGIASASWNKKLIPIRISNQVDGTAYTSDMYEAAIYAADNGAKVVSISYSGAEKSTMNLAGDYVKSKGGLFFMAAGNDGLNKETYPNYDNIIVIGATDSNDLKTSFSNYGSFVDLTAPGSGIYVATISSTGSNTKYTLASGTSYSSPLVASVAALLFSAYPAASNTQIEQALINGAVDLGDPGYDIYYGYGRVDALGAMLAMEDPIIDTTPPQVSINSPSNNAVIQNDIEIEVGASDNYGIDKVELYVDGNLYGSSFSQTNGVYIYYWDLTNYNNGAHELMAKAYDNYENTNTDTISVNVEKDNISPTIQITSPVDGSVIDSRFLYVITEASQNTASVDFYIDGAYKETDYSAPFSISKLNTKPYDGQMITIKAVATATNSMTDDSSVTVQIGNPVATTTISATTTSVSATTTVLPECDDQRDNDRDGYCDWNGCAKNKKFDYLPDPQCTGPNDTSESE